MIDKYTPPEITQSLSEISRIMADGFLFCKLRFSMERYEKEAKEGNKESATLVELVKQYERLIKIIIKD